MKPQPNWLSATRQASGPFDRSAVAAFTVASSIRRTPSTSPTVAAYIRARLRALVMPLAAGISVACTARVLNGVSGPKPIIAPLSVSALKPFVPGPITDIISSITSGLGRRR